MSTMSRTLVSRMSFRAATWNLHFLLPLLAIPFASAIAQGTEQTLYKIENDWARAAVQRDVQTLERLTAPKWVYSDESGVMDRAAGIKAFSTGTDTVRSATNENMHAMVYGTTAVVIGVLRMKGRGPTGPFDHRYRYTDTFVLMDGQWRCIASQDYLIPQR